MQIQTVSLFPEIFAALNVGMPARAQKQGQLRLQHFNPRDYTDNTHRTVDDKSYGGGPGMVMLAQPLSAAIEAAKAARPQYGPTLLLSPHGRRLDHDAVQRYARMENLTLVAGRYEGVDQRIVERHIDEMVSIGDFVLSGGELAAMVLIDAIARLLPGVLGNQESLASESFTQPLLDHPHYTRPAQWQGQTVPEPLQNGAHQAIDQWRNQQALGKTWLHRPDLLKLYAKEGQLSEKEKKMLTEFIKDNIM